MARPKLYQTDAERLAARRASRQDYAQKHTKTFDPVAPITAPAEMPVEGLIPSVEEFFENESDLPADPMVAVLDIATKRTTRNVFDAAIRSASPAERSTLYKFAAAIRRGCMVEFEQCFRASVL